jgi:Leucine-rich repeat (LRR) protein
MKKLLLILLCLPMIGFGQNVNIPDANFEQELIHLGYDNGPINGSVYTVFIDTVSILYVGGNNITDLTGIEDFIALTNLLCIDNQLTSLDLSNNTALETLRFKNILCA